MVGRTSGHRSRLGMAGIGTEIGIDMDLPGELEGKIIIDVIAIGRGKDDWVRVRVGCKVIGGSGGR